MPNFADYAKTRFGCQKNVHTFLTALPRHWDAQPLPEPPDYLKTSRAPELSYPEDLRQAARVYLGLRRVLDLSDWWHKDDAGHLHWIARAADVTVDRIGRIAAAVEQTDNLVVRLALEHGLPLSALTRLFYGESYLCPTCTHRRHYVPCILCARPWPDELRPDDAIEDDSPLVRPRYPTKAAPGSRRKMAIMAARVARGESCFHRDDRYAVSVYDDDLPDTVSDLVFQDNRHLTDDWNL